MQESLIRYLNKKIPNLINEGIKAVNNKDLSDQYFHPVFYTSQLIEVLFLSNISPQNVFSSSIDWVKSCSAKESVKNKIISMITDWYLTIPNEEKELIESNESVKEAYTNFQVIKKLAKNP